MLRFTSGEKEISNFKRNVKKSQNIMSMVVFKNFLLLLMLLLTAQIAKTSHVLPGIYFIFLKKRPGPNLKAFRYRIWTSVKR